VAIEDGKVLPIFFEKIQTFLRNGFFGLIMDLPGILFCISPVLNCVKGSAPTVSGRFRRSAAQNAAASTQNESSGTSDSHEPRFVLFRRRLDVARRLRSFVFFDGQTDNE
jgi:hypothetical protein